MKKRILSLLLTLVLLCALSPQLAPRVEAFDRINVKGTVKLSSYKTTDTLVLTGDTTLKVDASICLYGILSSTNSDGSPKYSLTIQGDGSHSLSIAGWENECIFVKNLELSSADVSCVYNLVQAHGTLKCTNSTWDVTMSSSSSSPLLFVRSTADFTSSTLNLTSSGKCYNCNSKTTLNSSTLNASAGSGATAIWTESLGGSSYTITSEGGSYGLMIYDQQYGPSPTLIDVQGTTAGIYCQRGNLSCAYTNILYPVNGTCNGTTVLDSSGKTAKRAVLGVSRSISGSVSCSSANPDCRTYIYPELSGAAASIPDADLSVVWQRSSTGSGGWTDRPDQNIENHGYKCDNSDVDQFLRVKVTAIGYTGALYSSPVRVSKVRISTEPTMPSLSFDGSALTVTNATQGQEYFSSTQKYTETTFTESLWSGAKKPASGQTILQLSYTSGKVNYVYTRIAETDWSYAGSMVKVSSIDCTKVYDLWVAGTQVNENNCSSLAGGAISYAPSSNTLTVKSGYSCSSNVISNRIPGLKIKVSGSGAKLTSTSANAIVTYADLTITGSGRLELEASTGCAIYVMSGAALSITDGAVKVTNSRWGVCGPGESAHHSEKLRITNSTVTASTANGAVCDFYGGITLSSSYVLYPQPSSFQNKDSSITLSNGTYAGFVEIHPQPFVDIKTSEYWFYPILWAYENNPQITNGTDTTHFSPRKDCTRAQVVTFLWRANGCPKPKSTSCPFTDVKSGSYYYEAMLWAVEKGITTGTSATTFGPDKACTRAQVVTFLWRAKGSPAPNSTSCPFTDVKPDSVYYKAILWAVEQGVTTGTSDTTFGPSKVCNRGQVVTFLYRVYGPQG